MSWLEALKGDPIPWLLEPDNPAARYLTLRYLLDRPPDDPEVRAALIDDHRRGPIPVILDAMHPDGYWVKPGAGYGPKYQSAVWSLIALAQLGARADQDERIARACEYTLDHALVQGRFTFNGTVSGSADCLHGNLCVALLDLGYDDPRLEMAFDWMARSVTGEGVAPASDRHAPVRYHAGKCGPGFACGANDKLPCAWGAVKVMLAFAKLPIERRTPLIERAIAQGIDFLLAVDPATAAYPTGYAEKPSGNWWKFGFPVFYVTDLLQIAEALTGLGLSSDPRLENALAIIREKQDDQGRWPLEYHYNGKTWVEFGRKGQPSKEVTIRALRVLKAVDTVAA
jgi:hypothetical protein